jgi:hypothetical protein
MQWDSDLSCWPDRWLFKAGRGPPEGHRMLPANAAEKNVLLARDDLSLSIRGEADYQTISLLSKTAFSVN